MKEFIHYLENKNFSKDTQRTYLLQAQLFLKWFKKDPITCERKDILKYLEHLKNKKQQQNNTRSSALTALKHYFDFLVQNEIVAQNPCGGLKIRGSVKKFLYNIYTTQQLEELQDNFYQYFIISYDDKKIKSNQKLPSLLCRHRNYIMLSLLIHQGLATNELQNISVNDIDITKATITIKKSTKRKERTIALKASQIGSLMNYLQHIRSQFFDFCVQSDNLFFALPSSANYSAEDSGLEYTLKTLKKQIKTINEHFLSFKQLRASVITQWLKTEGLRKTQYLAGHYSIASTESYLPNDLEQLTDDIAKFNPF